jgi:N-acetylmuramoyl-L-alanine amidase
MTPLTKYITSSLVALLCAFTMVNQDHPYTQAQDSIFRSCMAEKDCRLLLEAGYYESRSESDEGVVAVMHTILNRKSDRRWGNTIREVLYQKWQFSYTMDGSLKKGFTEVENHRRIAILARGVLNGDIEDPTNGAVFYHNDRVSPRWSKKKVKVAQIEKHSFYK